LGRITHLSAKTCFNSAVQQCWLLQLSSAAVLVSD
jgi:hypothetical protein